LEKLNVTGRGGKIMDRRTRAAALALTATLTIPLAACGDSAGLERLSRGEEGKVVEVRSGDVLALDNGLVVRLAGLEAPRFGDLGASAAQADLERLTQGHKVALYYGGARRDAFGRALAQVRLEDSRQWVQGVLLNDGVVRERTFADNRALSAPMLAAEAHARRARRGLWAISAYQVMLPREVTTRTDGFQIVEGRVRSAFRGRSGVELDLEGAHDGFTVEVSRAAAADLTAAGHPPESLIGKLVRVRGPVGRDGLMRLDHPEAIEPLKAG
jgi:micrococcal nuclease